jgi:NADH:ubiquinone oxidoreductase subunit C
MVESWITGLGKVYRKYQNSVFLDVPMKDLAEALLEVRNKNGPGLVDLCGYDNGKEYELSYTFSREGTVFTLRVFLPRDNPQIPTVTNIFPGAGIFERECYEMLGIHFPGNPNQRMILHADDTPLRPLRKKDSTAKK